MKFLILMKSQWLKTSWIFFIVFYFIFVCVRQAHVIINQLLIEDLVSTGTVLGTWKMAVELNKAKIPAAFWQGLGASAPSTMLPLT